MIKQLKQILLIIIGMGVGCIGTLQVQKIKAQSFQVPEIVCCDATSSQEHLAYSAEHCMIHKEERTDAYNAWLAGWIADIWREIKRDKWSHEYD